MTELISVIVPIYNVELYLKTCVNSIINQTYTNLEIILVASKSEDRSVEISNQYLYEDSRIRVIHRPRLGLSDARNAGIDEAIGKYICFIDSDDYIAPEYIHTLYILCKENNCEIAQCDYKRVNEDDTKLHKANLKEKVKIFSNAEMCANLYSAIAIPSVVAWSKLYKIDLFKEIRYPVGKLHEDTGTTHRLFYTATSIAVTNNILYYYRVRKSSIMTTDYTIKNLIGLTFHEEQIQFFMENDLQKAILPAIRECYYSTCYNLRGLLKYGSQYQIYIDDLKNKRYQYLKRMFSGSLFSNISSIILLYSTWIRIYLPTVSMILIELRKKLYWYVK